MTKLESLKTESEFVQAHRSRSSHLSFLAVFVPAHPITLGLLLVGLDSPGQAYRPQDREGGRTT